MPEQITKYPDVTLQVLKGSGAACGTGAPQKILTQCPADRFCSFPSGELCIYGLHDIPMMTQMTSAEIAAAVGPHSSVAPTTDSGVSPAEAIAMGALFILGIGLGRYWSRKGDGRRGASPPH